MAAPFRNHIVGVGKRNGFLKRRIVLFSEERGRGVLDCQSRRCFYFWRRKRTALVGHRREADVKNTKLKAQSVE